MVDSKMVVSQVQEMQIILHDIGVDGMELNESLHIVAMLCKDFKNYLNHKGKDRTMGDLSVQLTLKKTTVLQKRKV